MTQEQILEGNKLIAEFMGWYKSPYPNTPNKVYRIESGIEVGIPVHSLKYHVFWDELMPVVEKIAATPSITITIESFTVENGDRTVCSCSIEKTFWPRHAVCEKKQIAYKKEFTDKLPAIQNVWERIIEYITSLTPKSKEQ